MPIYINRYIDSVDYQKQGKIKKIRDENLELSYHKDNEEYLKNIMTEISIILRSGE